LFGVSILQLFVDFYATAKATTSWSTVYFCL